MTEKGHQYFSDEIIGDGNKSWRKSRYDRGGSADLFAHHDRLFDEDETQSGDLINPATGKRYDNSTYDGTESLTKVKVPKKESVSEDVLPPIKEEKDAAAIWLAEHDMPIAEVIEIIPIQEADAA